MIRPASSQDSNPARARLRPPCANKADKAIALTPAKPLRIARTPSDRSRLTATTSLLDKVVAIIGQAGFALRRRASSSSSTSVTEPQTPPPPGLEDHIAYALLTQGTHDRSGATRQAYQTARTLSRTTSEEFKELVNDFWVDPSSGLKASCLTHALLSGNQAVADMLEAHGAEESFVYPATDLEIRKT